ncbi:prenyltransferase [Micromonospora sp. R77]|uniref:prenyltransferase/squalene oxidase repeat-containing protein n=1 Tax=Micromonospora sp. R77 TaxID=2925836 RepID=UPI001F625730|nr:prenyltransferase/squalene oxidase repeat-containing protein [Micromonospora sp. R77]MCI4061610.1 prenyltransferase [Micromonospora sp. R77]
MTRPARAAALPRPADELVAGLSRRPWGQVDPSTYETARLVAVAPGLPGHDARVAHLLRAQRPTARWGPPVQGYALVPTVSATDALLAELARPGTPAAGLLDAVAGGLRALHGPLGPVDLPDTPGADLIVPALVGSIGERLDRLAPEVRHRLPAGRPGLPAGVTRERLDRIRAGVAAGVDLPAKLAHFVEVLELPPDRLPGAHGGDPLAVGAIPGGDGGLAAATRPPDGAAARGFLAELVRHGGGPVPCPTPITVFERAWVLSGLLRAGVPVVPPAALVDSLAVATGRGIATGAGLPTDADTTAVALDALGRLGRPADPAVLWEYETADGFCTWPGEDGFSVTTNAHVLDAFARHLAHHPDANARHRAVPTRLAAVLRERQSADGGWQDRWHASPYYATACCVLALVGSGAGRTAADAVGAAVRFVLRTQHADGSWGRWSGTVEETAYALHVLLAAPWAAAGVTAAIARGYGRLIDPPDPPHPPLWYGKELYRPVAVVEAAVLTARHLATEHLLRAGGGRPAREAVSVPKAGTADIQRLEGTCGHC